MNIRLVSTAFLAGARTFMALVLIGLLASGCGGGGGNSSPGTGDSILAVFAGNMGGSGKVDGTGPAARLAFPQAVTVDGAGNVYVTDGNLTIRKITPAGVVTTFAGTAGAIGSTDGTGAAARFGSSYFDVDIVVLRGPAGTASDSVGNVFVADRGNHTIRKITPAGVVTTLAGKAGVSGTADGIGAAARFHDPQGVATDSAGNVYVADTGNHTVRKISPSAMVTTLAGTAGRAGSTDGAGMVASLYYPLSISADSAGNVYVCETFKGTIRKITPAGAVTTLAGTPGESGSADGTGAAARFFDPQGVVVDGVGNVYVADTGNNTIRKITPAGVVTTLAGRAGLRGSADGTGAEARFYQPQGVASDSAGNIYVADTPNNAIRKITSGGVVTTLAGAAAVVGSVDGIGPVASFGSAAGIATDNLGNVYVADGVNNIIRKISPAGEVTTLAGTAGAYGSTDGTGAAARFDHPSGVAIDSAGNVYVADTSNSTIRKITLAGVVTTLAGTAGLRGSADGSGAAARFLVPEGVATDSAGNIYVADYGNSTIRKILPGGVVTTVAGTAGARGTADGTGATARFYYPSSIATDSAGNVYVADGGANNIIRKINSTGVVTTLAGMPSVVGSVGATWWGVAPSFRPPGGMAVDGSGNLYVVDSLNCVIGKITPAGVVTTVAGVAGQCDFVAGSLPGGLQSPGGIAIGGASLYIATPQGVAMVTNLH